MRFLSELLTQLVKASSLGPGRAEHLINTYNTSFRPLILSTSSLHRPFARGDQHNEAKRFETFKKLYYGNNNAVFLQSKYLAIIAAEILTWLCSV